MSDRFHVVLAFDEQTDEQTDRQTDRRTDKITIATAASYDAR